MQTTISFDQKLDNSFFLNMLETALQADALKAVFINNLES